MQGNQQIQLRTSLLKLSVVSGRHLDSQRCMNLFIYTKWNCWKRNHSIKFDQTEALQVPCTYLPVHLAPLDEYGGSFQFLLGECFHHLE